MRVETLIYEDETFHVGVGEFTNTNKLDKKKLVSLASERTEGVIAVQLLDSKLIAGETHLLSAAQNALNAWEGKYAISRSLDVEILLYASGQHQIGVALDKMGLSDETTSVAAVVLAKEESKLMSHTADWVDRLGPSVQQPFAPSEDRIQRIMLHFGIDEAEIAAIAISDSLEARYQALSGCVTSRVSMVALES